MRPFSTPIERSVDPLQVSLAVLHAGYWAEGLMLNATGQHEVRDRVVQALRGLVTEAKAGVRLDELAAKAARAIGPCQPHPMIGALAGHSIGMAVDEAPRLDANGKAVLESGAVYSLGVGGSDGKRHAMLSAMVLVGDRETQVLWSAV